MSPVQLTQLIEIDYPKELKQLTQSIKDHIKWNFVVRYFAKQAISEINAKTFFKWIKHSDQSFGEFDEEIPFVVTEEVSRQFTKIQALARRILLPSHPKTNQYLMDLVRQFQDQAKDIKESSPEQGPEIVEEFLDHIKALLTHSFSVTQEDKEVLFLSLSQLFSEKSNQALSDACIEVNLRAMFAFLEENPRISPGKFAQELKTLWVFPKDEGQKTVTNLSEFFVKYNPYNIALEKILCDAIVQDQPLKLIGKSLIYRHPICPFSIKIDQALVLEGSRAIRGIKLFSSERLSVILKVDIEKERITSLSFERLLQIELEHFIQNKDFRNEFQLEPKIPFPPIENPFEINCKYELEVKKGISDLGYNYTDYSFNSSKNTITFHVLHHNKEVRMINSQDNSSKKLEMRWTTYQTLFTVLTAEKEIHALSGTAEKLERRLISLSEKPLATEGSIKRALKEKDFYKMEFLIKLIENFHKREPFTHQVFNFINTHYRDPLPIELFTKIFDDNPLFHRLCHNQFIKTHYHIEEGEIFPLSLQGKFALDLLHEAQVLMLANIHPKEQIGHQDLMTELYHAAQATRSMQGIYAIPFIGPTGSGKSTAVSYFMGVPMEEFEDEYGEKRIKQKESSEGIPKIGFALGLSETILASAFNLIPPPPLTRDLRNPFALSKRDPHFKNGLTRENLKLVDFPGFFDTRGTNYELITNFGIDQAMKAFKGIPAIIQLIPYENFTANRARVLYHTLQELEGKFPALLINQEFHNRFHFVITKFQEIGLEQIKARLEELVNEYRAEGLAGVRYFEFLLHQLLTRRVHLLNPLSATTRLTILNSIIENFHHEPIDPIKADYQGGFKETSMQLRVGEVLNRTLLYWNRLLNKFLEDDGKQSQLKRLAVSLDYHKRAIQRTFEVSQMFQRLENEELEEVAIQKRRDAIGQCQQFATLYQTSIQQLERKIHRLLRTCSTSSNA